MKQVRETESIIVVSKRNVAFLSIPFCTRNTEKKKLMKTKKILTQKKRLNCVPKTICFENPKLIDTTQERQTTTKKLKVDRV